MKKIKAYTLMEMLVVMSIMIIILAIGLSSYAAYIETTKYNQDVSNLQQDILNAQRASMLLKREEDDGWLYGVGIDFGGMMYTNRNGTYKVFKWCSGYPTYGHPKTTGKYPNFNESTGGSNGMPNPNFINYGVSSCSDVDPDVLPNGALVQFSSYGLGRLNLADDVEVTGGRFLLFESVTGRAFIFDDAGSLVNADLAITFDKRRGTTNILEVENLTGRTKLSSTGDFTYDGGGGDGEPEIPDGEPVIPDGELPGGGTELPPEETQPIGPEEM
jgi:type II secretory pathway pseudopilin PulG